MMRRSIPARCASVAAILALVVPAAGGHAQNVGNEESPDTTGVRGLRLAAYPFVYYTPETEVAFGGGGILTYYFGSDPELRPSRTALSGYYSTRGQYKVSQDTEIYLSGNRRVVRLPVSFGDLVDKYWGLGAQTPESGSEDYDVRVIEGEVVVEGVTLLEGFLRDGIVYRASWRDVLDRRENPNFDDQTLGVDGGFTAGLGLMLVHDSRDHLFYPRDGGFATLSFVGYHNLIGSDFGFSELQADARWYRGVGSRTVVAAQGVGHFAFGDPPFYESPALGGGSIMRGYFQGRYRDERAAAVQAEVRQALFWRIGAVAFAGAGEVWGDGEGEPRWDALKYSVGFGLRFVFNRAESINLRADIGWGRGTTGLYFGIGEAF